ncbi:galactose-specific lectin nattectin [Austrofundulus limnaeus]|uniref:Galactose-specific lectin nattectin n=1 Tax=Austrofundulus limnaeus TaxID=52670 RepID=A0A2I4CN45_AUSLI|nr:PREDICTED: galactose-specific lectin nattectin-like [Austrofundulus limnaeus]
MRRHQLPDRFTKRRRYKTTEFTFPQHPPSSACYCTAATAAWLKHHSKMSSALLFTLLLSGLGIGGNIFSDAGPDGCGILCEYCPAGWTLYEEKCYMFMETATYWANAEMICNVSDAHLTSIHGPDEYSFIRGLINEATGENTTTWVGGTNGEGDYWTWSDGSPFNFTNWGPEEPDNVDEYEYCMEINLNGEDYVHAENCDTRNAFVCAKDALMSFPLDA